MSKDPTPLDILSKDIREMREDIKKLIQFRGWVLGAACIAGAIGGVLIRLL